MKATAGILAAGMIACGAIGDARGASHENGHVEPIETLDLLFEELKHTPDSERAKAVAAAIWRIWFKSGSDTVDLLMKRATMLIEARELEDAMQILDTVVEIAPDYAEGWNKRATVYFLLNQYGAAIADLQHVLTLEPRHFGALAGLGEMLEQMGRDEAALEIYRRALDVHPYLDDVRKSIDSLTIEVEGREI